MAVGTPLQVDIGKGGKAEIVSDAFVSTHPRWTLCGGTINVGPYRSSMEHEAHVLSTVGSAGWLWSVSDEFRFGVEDGILQSLLLHVPRHALEADESAAVWELEAVVPGSLRLKLPAQFLAEPAAVRWYARGQTSLVGLGPQSANAAERRLRLRVAPDVDLLFVDETLHGWMLLDAARYVVDSWDAPESSAPDGEFVALLQDYLLLVVDSTVERMEDRDPICEQALHALLTRCGDITRMDRRRHVLRGCIEGVLDTFYGDRSAQRG